MFVLKSIHVCHKSPSHYISLNKSAKSPTFTKTVDSSAKIHMTTRIWLAIYVTGKKTRESYSSIFLSLYCKTRPGTFAKAFHEEFLFTKIHLNISIHYNDFKSEENINSSCKNLFTCARWDSILTLFFSFSSLSSIKKVLEHKEYPGQRGTPMSLWNPPYHWKIWEIFKFCTWVRFKPVQTCVHQADPSLTGRKSKIRCLSLVAHQKPQANLPNGYQPEMHKAWQACFLWLCNS